MACCWRFAFSRLPASGGDVTGLATRAVALRGTDAWRTYSAAASAAAAAPAVEANAATAETLTKLLGPETYAPLHSLQQVYDEVLARPSRFPIHVRRVHQLAIEEQRRRQAVVDQSPLEGGCQALFTARKVIYVIIARSDSRLQLCATRFSCAQDFVERSARSHGKKRGLGRWLASQGYDNVLLYTVESLRSDQTPYGRIASRRLNHWSALLQDFHRGGEVFQGLSHN